MHWFGFCFKGLSPCTAPKEKQLHTRLWPRFRTAMANAVPGYSRLVDVKASRIRFGGNEDWGFVAETAKQPENLAGYHDDYMLIVVDEASGVEEQLYPVLEGAISTGKVVILLLLGNPTQNIGTFHASHCRPAVAKHYFRIHISLDKAPRVNRAWVERMRQRYGEDSPIYKVRCLGEFAEQDRNQLIPLQWLLDARDREFVTDGTHPGLRVSADVADGGDDECSFTIAQQYASFLRLRRQINASYPSSKAPILAAEKAAALFDEWGGSKTSGIDWIVVDANAVGAGTAGALMRMGYPVIAYKGGEASDDTKLWRNRRTQSYLCLRDDARDGRLVIDDDFVETDEEWEEFYAQVCSIRNKPGQGRVEDLETKLEMTRKGVKSPDRGDSVAMLYATDIPHLEGRDAVLGAPVELATARSEAARGYD
jgi:hypothetical protein